MDVLLIAALGAFVIYIGACAVWPFTACGRCKGAARLRSPSGRAWRSCPRCAGSGKRIRFGRYVWEALTRSGGED